MKTLPEIFNDSLDAAIEKQCKNCFNVVKPHILNLNLLNFNHLVDHRSKENLMFFLLVNCQYSDEHYSEF